MNCLDCGACCKVGLMVEVIRGLDQVPLHYLELIYYDRSEIWSMRRNKDGVCIAYDLDKKRCKIYEIRPMTCREFKPGCGTCLTSIKMDAEGSTYHVEPTRIDNE